MKRQVTLFLAIVAALFSTTAQAGEIIDTLHFPVVNQKVAEFSKKYGAENVLVVFDADNTLLAMNQDLGSNQWYEWQAELQKHEPTSPFLVAPTFPELLSAQARIFGLGKMHTPENEIAASVKKFQTAGSHCLVLTARGSDTRDATERELKRNNLTFKTADQLFRGLANGAWKPYNSTNIAPSGLTAKEQALFKLGSPRDVSYGNGVMMVAGQHKGAMLLILLAHSPRRFSAIVFVDDSAKNTNHVFQALECRNYPNAIIRYGAEDQHVKAFQKKDKHAVDQQWRKLDATINAIFK